MTLVTPSQFCLGGLLEYILQTRNYWQAGYLLANWHGSFYPQITFFTHNMLLLILYNFIYSCKYK